MANHPNRKQGPKGPSLVQSALDAIKLPGFTDRAAAAALVEAVNADLSTGYTTNDLGKWRRGDRPIPQPAQDWMLRTSVAHAIRQCGGVPPSNDDQLDLLATMLCPPKTAAIAKLAKNRKTETLPSVA